MTTDFRKLRFRPACHSGNSQCARSSYAYKPLHTKTSIRVLKIHPPEVEGTTSNLEELANIKIKASLVEIDLNDAPVFNALSYTWGDPVVFRFKGEEFLPVKDWYCQCHVIDCDGQEITVGANLFSALFEIRYLRSHGCPWASKTDWKDLLGCPIWIDALCINQGDLDEKATQIPLMGRIYSQAKHTVAYLGGADDASVTAMPFIQSFVRAVSSYQERTDRGLLYDLTKGSGSMPMITGKILQKYKIPVIPDDSLPHLYAFCTRAWFMRTWVMQEIALSRHTVLVCGGMSIDMGDFQDFVRVTHQITGFFRIPTVDSQGNLEHWWDRDGERRSLVRSPKELQCREGQENPLWSIWSAAFQIKEQNDLQARDGFMIPILPNRLSELINKFRNSGAAEPRDKIYGVLSLHTGGWGPPDRISHPPVDYKKPLQSVYLEWTRYILESEQDLAYLGLASSGPDSEPGNESDALPSWVPNLHKPAVGAMSVNLNLIGSGCPFSTMRAVGPFHLSFPDESTLKLRGRRIGSVVALQYFSGPNRTNTIFDHGSFLLNLPTYTWVPNAQPTIQHLAFHAHSYLLKGNALEDAGARMQEAAAKAEGGTFQSRYEVYWRTLLMDQCDRRHPAPEAAGPQLMQRGYRLLARCLLWSIRDPQDTSLFERFLFLLDAWGKLHKPGELTPAEEFTEGTLNELVAKLGFYEDIFSRYVLDSPEESAQDLFNSLSLDSKLLEHWLIPMLEDCGFVVLLDTDAFHQPDVLVDPDAPVVLAPAETSSIRHDDEQTGSEQVWESKIPRKDDDSSGDALPLGQPQFHMPTEPPIQFSSRFNTGRIDPKDVQGQYEKAVMNKTLVRLGNGLLGLANWSSQIGDEVWALAGSQVPFTLRKESCDEAADEPRYRLVGEAYVHGAMHGDVIEEDKMDDVQYVYII